MQNSPPLLHGALLVLLGASSYGLLSTFVKLAYQSGFTTAEVTTSQFFWGTVAMSALALWFSKASAKPSRREKIDLVLAGTTTGFTSVFYYIAVKYIPASIAVVLLMQSIWMGVVWEGFLRRQLPGRDKVVAVILVLIGTILATNLIDRSTAGAATDLRGVIFGLISALSYTCTLVATGRVAPRLSAVLRSQYMLFGGCAVAFTFAMLTQIGPHYLGWNLIDPELIRDRAFDFKIFGTYGLIVAIFGTILPPIAMNKGFPVTGVGLGSIISSIELPFAALVACTVLGERLSGLQVLGIGVILISVFVLNYRMISRAARA